MLYGGPESHTANRNKTSSLCKRAEKDTIVRGRMKEEMKATYDSSIKKA
jgi:hypothetical protein